jgi:hypothetical protein
MDSFTDLLRSALDNLQCNHFHLRQVLYILLPLAEPQPLLTDSSTENVLNPMYTVFQKIRFITLLITKLVLLVV